MLGEEMDVEEIKEVLDEYDTDKSGSLDFKEFVVMMQVLIICGFFFLLFFSFLFFSFLFFSFLFFSLFSFSLLFLCLLTFFLSSISPSIYCALIPSFPSSSDHVIDPKGMEHSFRDRNGKEVQRSDQKRF
jgi:uncharacterized membrane protein YjjP (DUF1212 family)